MAIGGEQACQACGSAAIYITRCWFCKPGNCYGRFCASCHRTERSSCQNALVPNTRHCAHSQMRSMIHLPCCRRNVCVSCLKENTCPFAKNIRTEEVIVRCLFCGLYYPNGSFQDTTGYFYTL